jgi:hypothetical protein
MVFNIDSTMIESAFPINSGMGLICVESSQIFSLSAI